MPVNQITAGQKDWLTTLNNNSNLINKLPVDGAVSTNSGITFKNGASAQNFKCWYVQFNGFKLVNMAFDQLDCPVACNTKPILSVPTNLAPSHPIAVACNADSTLNNYISTDFIWWTNASVEQKNQVVSMTYIHVD